MVDGNWRGRRLCRLDEVRSSTRGGGIETRRNDRRSAQEPVILLTEALSFRAFRWGPQRLLPKTGSTA